MSTPNFFALQHLKHYSSTPSLTTLQGDPEPEPSGIDEDDQDLSLPSPPSLPQPKTLRHQTETQKETPSNDSPRYKAHSAPQTPAKMSSHYGSPYARFPPSSKGMFLSPSNGQERVDLGAPNIGLSTSGGRNRLTRRAGLQPCTSSPGSMVKTPTKAPGNGDHHNQGDGQGKKRNRGEDDKENGVEDVEEVPDDFDPQAPVDIFDYKTHLEDEWDALQGDINPFLEEFAKKTLANAYEIIFTTAYCFRQLETQTRDSLIKGIEDIKAEEAKHEEARKTITDFAEEMQKVARMLQKYQGGWAGGGGSDKDTDTEGLQGAQGGQSQSALAM